MNEGITLNQAQAFLAGYYATKSVDAELIGAGAWSRCFGYRHATQELAIRFGMYIDDFQHDQRAASYASAELPIPQVLDIGQAYAGYYAISTRVHGVPLESLNASEWQAIVPSLVLALDAIRCADIAATSGYGGWDTTGNAPHTSWAQHLLCVDVDNPTRRTYGWRARLATLPEGEAAFAWGYDLLKQVAYTPIPRSLVHCDLINRNVLVDRGKLAGVFDWGCSLYGDHLYDLAWFEFWAPWHPELDSSLLRSALEAHWQSIGYVLPNKTERLMACYLHIGLDHLAYNAHLGDWATLGATAERMRLLVLGIQ
jgi:hygromycin-B 4-O-kinase